MRLWVQGLLGSYVISNLENKKEELSVFDDQWMCILTVFLSLSLSLEVAITNTWYEGKLSLD